MFAERILPGLLLALAGCGSLAGRDYQGEPLFQIEGVVQSDAAIQLDGEVGVALLWANDSVADLSAQAVVVETRFPARYTLKIYRAPPEASKLQVVGGQTLEASVGQILLFEDRDANGSWNTDTEPLIGGAFNAAVLFVPGGDLPYVPDEVGVPAADPTSGDDVDSPDLDPAPRSAPLWRPTGGFHLIEVAPGPSFCKLQWEDWMQPADETAATLYVGFYGNRGNDWDCDGAADFEEDFPEEDFTESGASEDPDVNLDGPEPCPPEEILAQECAFIDESLEDLDSLNPAERMDYVGYLMDWVDQFPSCLESYCPEVVAGVRQAGTDEGWPETSEP